VSAARPVYPTWIRSKRVALFWLAADALLTLGVVLAFVLHPAWLLFAALSCPFFYIAVVLTLTVHRLGPRGGDFQARIHRLLVEAVGTNGRLLDIGCGSGQLLIRCAKAAPGRYVGLDHWGTDWEYSRAQALQNAAVEGLRGLEFQDGTASHLPFETGSFERVVSCLTFHEVRDVPDKAQCLSEALRVLRPAGTFAFVDLFDDVRFFGGRSRVLGVIARAGGQVESAQNLSELLPLGFPLNSAKVLRHAVLVRGTKAPASAG